MKRMSNESNSHVFDVRHLLNSRCKYFFCLTREEEAHIYQEMNCLSHVQHQNFQHLAPSSTSTINFLTTSLPNSIPRQNRTEEHGNRHGAQIDIRQSRTPSRNNNIQHLSKKLSRKP